MKEHYGKCALCRKECNLSFEHIPPRAAFNSTPCRPVSGDKMIGADDRMPWDTSGLRYMNQQQGMGKYSLCPECNSNTGTWYGNSYIKVAHIVHGFISKPIDPAITAIGVKQEYPLRFIKQVLSMFCSINPFEDERIETLRRFVLQKDAIGLDKTKYKLCMYFTKSKLTKFAPLSVVLRKSGNTFESMAVSEITAYPLGFVLFFSPTNTWDYDGIDITGFSDYDYNCEATLGFPICILDVNDIFPTLYRTKEEIRKTIEENRKGAENAK